MKHVLPLLLLLGLGIHVHAKRIVIAYDADPVSLDPHEQLSGGTLQMSHMIFDPLIRWTKEFGFEARLAEKWERVDDNTFRFHLRKGVTFHSGNPLTAKDVAWTIDRLKRSPDYKGLFEPFSGVKVIDDHTFDLRTAEPYPLVLPMATYIFPMDSVFYTGTDANGKAKDQLVKHGNSFASRSASGTGAFVVASREQGVRVEFKRFEKYWDTQSPGNVTELALVPIKEGPTRVAALLSGDVQFIAPVPPTDMDRIKRNPNFQLVTMSGTRIITFQLNQKRRPEFKDARVRQAMVHAINNEGIAKKLMRGFATPAAQQAPPGYVGHNPALKPRYDLKKAQALMKEAGLSKGFSCTMMAPNNRYVNDYKIAEAVVNMLARIHIKVELKTLPKAQYWPKFDERAADMMMIGWHSDTEDAANFSEFLCMTPDPDGGYGQYNSGNYSNPDVDRLIKQARTLTDKEARRKILEQVEQILHDDAAFIPLHWQNLAWAAAKNVHIERVVNVMNFPYLGDLVVE